jgi:hypothetical protein
LVAAAFFAAGFLAAAFGSAAFLAGALRAGAFLPGFPAFSAIKASASSRVTASGVISFGRVALTLAHLI